MSKSGVFPEHYNADVDEGIFYDPSVTCERFHQSNAMVRGLMGPIGSGKSVACVMELFALAQDQEPYKGVRYSRFAIVRNTYGELKTTTIKTFQQWLPDEICPITYDSPIRAHMNIPHPKGDGTRLDIEFLFLSMDRPKDSRKVLSLEINGAWLNEARELDKAVVDAVMSRLGRYPGSNLGGCTRKSLIMDTNPPDTEHWWYKIFEKERPENWALFKQPGGLMWDHEAKVYCANPKAENIENLHNGYAYYMDQLGGKDKDFINVYLMGQYGSLFTGRPVYEHYFDHESHVSPVELVPHEGMPLMLGWDFGLTPSCIIGQLTTNGQLRILRELYMEGAGVKQFAEDHVLPLLAADYPGLKILSTGDPAGATGSQHDIEITCMSELERLGIPTRPASTNVFGLRRQAVINFLSKKLGSEPGLLIDPRCDMIVRGFGGGYQYSRVQVSGEERYRDIPNKNRFSHPHDALQYLALSARGDHIQVESPLPPIQPQPDTWAAFNA